MIEEKHLFEVDKMEDVTYKYGKKYNVHSINIEETEVLLDGIQFYKNTISKIEVFKYPEEGIQKAWIVVKVYMGDINIATRIYSSDVLIIQYSDETERVNECEIRKAESFDYPGKG